VVFSALICEARQPYTPYLDSRKRKVWKFLEIRYHFCTARLSRNCKALRFDLLTFWKSCAKREAAKSQNCRL
jgi:hypothetical protein